MSQSFTPTKHIKRCDCGRLFVVSQEAAGIHGGPDSVVHCLHCIDGEPHPEELALDVRTIGFDQDGEVGVQITLPTWDHWRILMEAFGVGFDRLQPDVKDADWAKAKELYDAAYEHGV